MTSSNREVWMLRHVRGMDRQEENRVMAWKHGWFEGLRKRGCVGLDYAAASAEYVSVSPLV
jgi:hypothetical protein